MKVSDCLDALGQMTNQAEIVNQLRPGNSMKATLETRMPLAGQLATSGIVQ